MRTDPGWLPRATWLEILLLAAGCVLTVQYAWLMDDAYVYFRYADNFLWANRGLVYNAGEYVEGFSSPLWMLILLLVRATGIDWWTAIRLLGVLSFLVFWALALVVTREASPRGASRVNLPLVLLVPNYAVLCYFTSGLEAPLVQVMAAVFALAVLRPASAPAQIAAGLAPLVRHELALPVVLLVGWCWWRSGRLPTRLLLTTTLATGAWLLFRVWYYADLLPNTFYLKDDWSPVQGLLYLRDTASTYKLFAILGVVFALFALLWRRDRVDATSAPGPLRLAERAFLLLLAAAVTAYVVKIGGDPRHYRYLAFPYCLAILATAGIIDHVAERWLPRVPAWSFRVAALAVVLTIATLYPRQLSDHPLRGPRPSAGRNPATAAAPGELPFHQTVDRINDAAVHRHHSDLTHAPWSWPAPDTDKDAYRRAGAAPVELPHRDVVIHGWCFAIYRVPESRAIHRFGLTDAFLARTRMKATRPGHKYGLQHLTTGIERAWLAVGNRPRRGTFRHLVENGTAEPWMVQNLRTIETIERKVFNRHDLFENVQLALTFPAPIEPATLLLNR